VINPTTAGGKAGGTITFTLYGPNSCTLLAIGTGSNPQNVSVNGDATYGPVSFTPVAAGTYSWVASYGGDSPNTNGTSHNTACNDTGEDVVVEVLPTTTVTTPVDVTGGAITSVSLNTSVYDHAVVTGQALGGSPSGSVSFFICNPTQVSGSAGSEVCLSSAGSPVGSAVPTTAGPGANQSQATSSPAVVANQVGVWCFRATFTPSTPGYTGSSDNSHDECFTVTDTTSISTAQNWLPNDSATITSGGSTLDGTVTFTLYDNGTCTGNNPIYTEGPITVSGGTSQTVHTNNGTVKVSASATVSWKVVYTSNNGFVTGSSTSCTEVTGLSISN